MSEQELDKIELDKEIMKRLLAYREVVTIVVTGAKSDGTNRAVWVSDW